MKYFIIPFLLLCQLSIAQYEFKIEKQLDYTPVKDQYKTGTCWSFSTISFLESELIRMGHEQFDLSEMYIVKNIYFEKATNYILRQGKTNFSEGALAHDAIRAMDKYGLIPQSKCPDIEKELPNDHEVHSVLSGMVHQLVKDRTPGKNWKDAYKAVLDVFYGKHPVKFDFDGKTVTPKEFSKSLGLNASDYVSITSFTHHPFYEKFILEIPDNFSNESYYNVPLNDLEEIVDKAIAKGYTINWDGDVSEKYFSSKKGIAILPVKDREEPLESPGEEIEATQELRQEKFESYTTKDDHLMHLVGIAKDQNNTKYYIIKNSWGTKGEFEGLLYMSESYFRLKTIAILLNKQAIDKDMVKKIGLVSK